mmetsp:Transcript_17247/g.29189  ORF Transcript_17247/g.29189 Transcript_17247/m.29189 type:complete len:237 (+) Transcript_17247:3109-3819(+)
MRILMPESLLEENRRRTGPPPPPSKPPLYVSIGAAGTRGVTALLLLELWPLLVAGAAIEDVGEEEPARSRRAAASISASPAAAADACCSASPTFIAMKLSKRASFEVKEREEKSLPDRGEFMLTLLDAWMTPTTSSRTMIGAHTMHRVFAPSFVSSAGIKRGSCATSGTFAQIFFETTSPSMPELIGTRTPIALRSLEYLTTNSSDVDSFSKRYIRSAPKIVTAEATSRSNIFLLA